MELVRQKSNTVYLEGETEWGVAASWKFAGDDGDSIELAVEETEPGLYSAVIPYLDTEGEVEVTWELVIPYAGEFTRKETYQVITPLLSIREVKAIVPEATDDEARDLEASVRHIIQGHCGQSFGYSEKTLRIPGDGEKTLKLPERLIDFTDISANGYAYNPVAFATSGDGWYLKLYTNVLETVKQMPSEISLDHGPVITTPYTAWYAGFHPAAMWSISGAWGYSTVPPQIKEAAKLLVNDLACSEVAYRDKYLKSIRAADWRLEFNSNAFAETGNARVDHLLAPFTVFEWLVI